MDCCPQNDRFSRWYICRQIYTVWQRCRCKTKLKWKTDVHIWSVEGAKSKTRPLAFQIVENSPALMLSGSSTEETDDWIKSLKELFWPKENVDEGNLESHLKLHRHVRCTYRFSALHSCLYTCTCVIFLSSPRLNFNACTVF